MTIPLRRDEAFNPGWLATLGGKNSRLRSAIITGMAAYGAYQQLHERYTTRRDRRTYVVSVPDTDEIYYDVHAWVLQQLPPRAQRSLRVFTLRTEHGAEAEDGPARRRRTRQVRLRYDGERSHELVIDGQHVTVATEEPEIHHSSEPRGRSLGRPGMLVFRSQTLQGRDAVLRLLARVTDEVERREHDAARVFIASRWGAWESISGVQPRPLTSVVLAGTLREELVADLETFLQQESVYRQLGIPWHRGFLLHGPPGVGKTSVAEALAGHFDMDVYYVPLSDLDTDTDLANLMSRVEPRSLLLLEDVDVASASHERGDERRGVSLSGLLNALDGVITPHGMLTIMTSNEPDRLDDALLRPGRADRIVRLDYVDGEQLARLVSALLDVEVEPNGDVAHDLQITPAEVVEAVKPHLLQDEWRAALTAITTLVDDRLLLRTSHEPDPA